MKKKTAKQPKQSKRTVKDLKPKKDAKGGSLRDGRYTITALASQVTARTD